MSPDVVPSSLFDRLGGRKFIAYLVTIGVVILLHWLSPKGMTSDVTTALLGALGLFIGGNVINTVAAARAAPQAEETPEVAEAPAPAAPPAPADPTAARLDEVLAQLAYVRAVVEASHALTNQVGQGVAVIGNRLAPPNSPR